MGKVIGGSALVNFICDLLSSSGRVKALSQSSVSLQMLRCLAPFDTADTDGGREIRALHALYGKLWCCIAFDV